MCTWRSQKWGLLVLLEQELLDACVQCLTSLGRLQLNNCNSRPCIAQLLQGTAYVDMYHVPYTVFKYG